MLCTRGIWLGDTELIPSKVALDYNKAKKEIVMEKVLEAGATWPATQLAPAGAKPDVLSKSAPSQVAAQNGVGAGSGAGLKQVTYIAKDGTKTEVLVPADASAAQYAMGVPIGPPDLGSLELPKEVRVRLNNQLWARKLFTMSDVRRRRQELFAALQAAFRVDTDVLVNLYEVNQ